MNSKPENDVSHLIVYREQTFDCRTLQDDGTSYPSWLVCGKHQFEGCFDTGPERYLKLRSPEGEIQVVPERELRGSRSACRIYRKKPGRPGTPSPPSRPPVEHLWPGNLRAMTPAKQRAVRRARRLPGNYLGRYEQMGSFETWWVAYAIQPAAEGWLLHFSGNQDEIGPCPPQELAERIGDRGLDLDVFLRDLRASGEAELAELAAEIEAAGD